MNNRSVNRLHNYHPTKRELLGPVQPQPAWRTTGYQPASHDPGGKVLVANLPGDVDEFEVKDLFQRTVGHVKDLFLIYNNQGHSKGMSIVSFGSAKSAVLARQKYNGKLVDNRHRIKIEIIHDSDLMPGTSVVVPSPTAQAAPTLLSRMTPSIVSRPSIGGGAKKRQKKGPKRVNKRNSVSAAQLDKEMDDWQAQAR
ncbi:hypothetical protein K488DRAFT_48994 [Vararia minispora EC-137]|uniref:Uncharacterized protein n=1 Tax=Vararia minispora EC-137 TaxID=1314806 RepID=A0ACB8QMX6_9AGAM|nr:hypothetical protein K488DRAFT_48994 [Vararia minispora EC-137]